VWWDRWIPDDAWVDYLHQYGNLGCLITNSEFNRAFQHSGFYKMIWSASEVRNDVGIYLHKKYVNNQRVSFILFQKIKMKCLRDPLVPKNGQPF